MRQDLRQIKRYLQIAICSIMSLCLNGCAVYQRGAIDYLPETAKFLIENDINRSGGTENDQHTISVTAMLSSILGDEKEDVPEALILEVQAAPIIPKPRKKPTYIVQDKVLDVIDLIMGDRDVETIKQHLQKHDNAANSAEISVGPVEKAESMQLASLKAMAKASAIGKEIKDQFKAVSIKFNPLLPRGTIKIVIMGKKDA